MMQVYYPRRTLQRGLGGLYLHAFYTLFMRALSAFSRDKLAIQFCRWRFREDRVPRLIANFIICSCARCCLLERATFVGDRRAFERSRLRCIEADQRWLWSTVPSCAVCNTQSVAQLMNNKRCMYTWCHVLCEIFRICFRRKCRKFRHFRLGQKLKFWNAEFLTERIFSSIKQ